MLLFVCHNREDEVSPPSTFLTMMTKDETVQLLSCDSASTCADEVSDHALLTPIVCKPASADPLVVNHTYTISQMTENTPTETKVTLVTSLGQPVGMGSIINASALPMCQLQNRKVEERRRTCMNQFEIFFFYI